MDVIEGMRTFVAVAEAGSFRIAAERLGISGALASKYVGQLEERLGIRLLNRTTRSVRTTEVGRAYMERCAELLEDFDDLEAAVQNQQAAPRGNIRITAPVTFGELVLPKVLADFTDRYPEIAIDLSLSDRYVNLVEEGFDVAIRVGALGNSSLIARKLVSTKLTVCAAPDYVARHGAPAHPADLQSHQCIVDENFRGGDRWPFDIDGRTEAIGVGGNITVNNARAAREFALAGRGIGLNLSFLVDEDIRTGRLQHLLTDFQTPELEISALYPHSRHLAAKIRALIDFLAAKIPAHCR